MEAGDVCRVLDTNVIFSWLAQFFLLPCWAFSHVVVAVLYPDPVPSAPDSSGIQEGWGPGSRVVNIPC